MEVIAFFLFIFLVAWLFHTPGKTEVHPLKEVKIGRTIRCVFVREVSTEQLHLKTLLFSTELPEKGDEIWVAFDRGNYQPMEVIRLRKHFDGDGYCVFITVKKLKQ